MPFPTIDQAVIDEAAGRCDALAAAMAPHAPDDDRREFLLDQLNLAEVELVDAGRWCVVLARIAPGSDCHKAALLRAECANRAMIAAQGALEDFDDCPEYRALMKGAARRLMAAHREAELAQP